MHRPLTLLVVASAFMAGAAALPAADLHASNQALLQRLVEERWGSEALARFSGVIADAVVLAGDRDLAAAKPAVDHFGPGPELDAGHLFVLSYGPLEVVNAPAVPCIGLGLPEGPGIVKGGAGFHFSFTTGSLGLAPTMDTQESFTLAGGVCAASNESHSIAFGYGVMVHE